MKRFCLLYGIAHSTSSSDNVQELLARKASSFLSVAFEIACDTMRLEDKSTMSQNTVLKAALNEFPERVLWLKSRPFV